MESEFELLILLKCKVIEHTYIRTYVLYSMYVHIRTYLQYIRTVTMHTCMYLSDSLYPLYQSFPLFSVLCRESEIWLWRPTPRLWIKPLGDRIYLICCCDLWEHMNTQEVTTVYRPRIKGWRWSYSKYIRICTHMSAYCTIHVCSTYSSYICNVIIVCGNIHNGSCYGLYIVVCNRSSQVQYDTLRISKL